MALIGVRGCALRGSGAVALQTAAQPLHAGRLRRRDARPRRRALRLFGRQHLRRACMSNHAPSPRTHGTWCAASLPVLGYDEQSQ